MVCEDIFVTLSVIINLGSTILSFCGHGEWRMKETLLRATENCGEIISLIFQLTQLLYTL
jgi:hypothetical protein